jgi:uncharacterized protein
MDADDFTLRTLATGLINRRIFRLEWHQEPLPKQYIYEVSDMVQKRLDPKAAIEHFVYFGAESNQAYDTDNDPIRIIFNNGQVRLLTECSDVPLYTQLVTKYFICYPKSK